MFTGTLRERFSDVNSLDTNIGFLVARTARILKRTLEHEPGKFGITATQYLVLTSLGENDNQSLSELGRRLDFDGPTITGIVDRVTREKLVERQRTDGDRRVVRVRLTRKGAALIPKVDRIAKEINQNALAPLHPEERTVLIGSAIRIWEQLKNPEE